MTRIKYKEVIGIEGKKNKYERTSSVKYSLPGSVFPPFCLCRRPLSLYPGHGRIRLSGCRDYRDHKREGQAHHNISRTERHTHYWLLSKTPLYRRTYPYALIQEDTPQRVYPLSKSHLSRTLYRRIQDSLYRRTYPSLIYPHTLKS